jgi:hypothetical protein
VQIKEVPGFNHKQMRLAPAARKCCYADAAWSAGLVDDCKNDEISAADKTDGIEMVNYSEVAFKD